MRAICACLTALTLIAWSGNTLSQTNYRIKALGPLGGCTDYAEGNAFNEAGQVAGEACNAHGDDHAFLWRNNGGPMVDLGPPEVGSTSYSVGLNASGVATGTVFDSTGVFVFTSSGDGTPMKRIYDVDNGFIEAGGINDLGQLTGSAYLGGSFQHAFLWKNDGSPYVDLGTLGGDSSFGLKINASGEIAGYSYIPGTVSHYHAFLWKNDGSPMLDLGSLGGDSSANFINASGQVAGTSRLPGTAHHVGNEHAFLWRNDGTPMQDLGTLGGALAYPTALNDSGQVSGFSDTRTINTFHAFVYLNDGSRIKDLGTLGGSSSVANDINASGQVTGWANLSGDTTTHAYLWKNNGKKMRDLNNLIDPADPLKAHITLIGGEFINDHADIVADGIDDRTGRQGLYLLEATPGTSSVITVAPGSISFGSLPINSSSVAQSVTVTNTGANAAAITSIALRGTSPGQFAFTEACGNSLASHASCTIHVTFKPTATGAKTAFLDVNGGGGGLRAVKLTGTGT